MKTQVKKVGDTIVVTLDGRLDFETSVPLREDLERIVRKAKTDSVSQIVFNCENLEFVGSSGISSFVQTLKDFNAAVPSRPRYCNFKSEFKRVIRAFDNDELFDLAEGSGDGAERGGKKPIDN